MIRYLFDTDTASYFLKGKNPVLQDRCRDALSAGDVAISVITEAELLFGLALAPDANRLQTVVKIFLSSVPCFDWTRTAAEHFARARAHLQRIGQPIGILDTQIAAHAIAENLVLVTNNTSHFGRIEGLKLENWYQDA
ncbi:MAG: type II toxin-antitoxin system VapC family toxin [Pseudomonadota bacterium]|nr:type II toxin-antitoxin system VapC family toxin [Burkholderiales bacterium]MDQ3197395.1 type II toxin-antitoxin system VapC family toxin [Pseudomonadota bacterium]